MENNILVTTADSEIISTRVFNTTQNNLFQCWSNPDLLKQWWGPAGFTNTFHEFNFNVGGHWKFTMHGPDKGNYENECVFIKIEPPVLIAWNRISKPLFQVVAEFEYITENSTRLIFKMLFATAEECNKLKPFVVDKNEENFDKLELVLAQVK
jgi:uncharacterized protein YndB with AHSA1/START domain